MRIFDKKSIFHSKFRKPSSFGSQIIFAAFLFFSVQLNAQEFTVNGPDIDGCGGFLVDSGASAGDYAANEDETITICSAAPETIITLIWNVFNLGAGDFLEIYDGASIASPLIGIYAGNDLMSQIFTSTNGSGCYTLHFVSDGNDEGNFAAEISCGVPCQPPTSSITSNTGSSPLLLCPGESISFDGSATEFFNGGDIESFSWDFDDGTTNSTNWPVVTHTFDEPGGYKVQLSVTDNNGCVNTNLNDFLVLVSTNPNFNLITDISDLCSGGEAFLGVTNLAQDSTFYNDSLNLWISQPWTDLPNNFNPEGIFVDDDQSQCQDFYFTYNGFAANEIIDDVSDIENIYLNFEHSFMQDLIITMICPNGQAVTLHQQTGGGTNLGEPEILDGPGVGYLYTFSPDATNGTWGDNLAGPEIPAGDYETVSPMSDLIGCPLNGTWTLEFCDTWGGDDGYVFDYGVQFEASLYGEILNFSPSYGPGCDSTYWEGPGIVSESEGCDYINVILSQAGTYEFQYTATNDFGCSFDTTITITVDTAPTINAGIDMTLDCLNPDIALQGTFNNLPEAVCGEDGGTFSYTYDNDEAFSWTFCPDQGAAASTAMTFSFISGEMENFFERLIVYDGPDNASPVLIDWTAGNATGMSWTASNPEGCLTVFFQSDFSSSAADGDFAPWTYAVGCEQIAPVYEWYWTPSSSLINAENQNTDVAALNQTTTYTLTAYPAGQPNCASTDQVTITVSNDFEVETLSSFQACTGELTEIYPASVVGGTAPFELQWIDESGTIISQDTAEVVAMLSTDYMLIGEDACGLRDSAFTTVNAHPSLEATFSMTGFEGCGPINVLMVSTTQEYQNIAEMVWHFDDGDSTHVIASSNHEYTEAGVYYPWLQVVDQNGCLYADTTEIPVRVFPSPVSQFSVDEQMTFLPNTTFRFQNESTDGEYFQWLFDEFDLMEVYDTTYTFPLNTEGSYVVELYAYNQYGCADQTEMTVIVDEEIDLYIPNSFTPDYDGINDVWLFKGSGFNNFVFNTKIFNRWGELMFETNDPDQAWTGNYMDGGNFVPDGLYFYRIQVRDSRYEIGHIFEGHITVVR